jgi:tRNA threonylcarbamoyladenosine biosynthesis protein TsaB
MSTLILHIETATKACSVALSMDGDLLAIKESTSDSYIHGESLTLFIEEVFRIANLKIEHLAAISISSGPGSYTGLRIGVSTAKGLCFGLQIPLIQISTLDSLIQISKNEMPTLNLLAVIDARRMEVYSLMQSPDGKILKSLSANTVDENSYSEFDPFFCFGDATFKLKELWANRDIIFKDEIYCSAKGQVEIAFSKFKAQEFEDLGNFVPFYLKEFQTNL